MRALPFATVLMLYSVSYLAAQGTPSKDDSLHWGPAPTAFPRGAQMAVVSGDPTRAGAFRIQLKMPDGYRIPPHSHPTDEMIEIKQGTFVVGMGDTFDLAKTKAMATGEQGTVPANAHHYGQARGETIVSVTAVGPFAMTYVNPADDPRKPARP
jgi:quercetin dioxygenase-like cupin family protein